MTEVRVINNIVKEYPTMFKVCSFKHPRIYVNDGGVKRVKEIVGDDYIPKLSSLSRTKTLIHDLILCNDFDLFCTFTFDPEKVDRFNFNACSYKVSRWIHHQKEKSPDMKYLIVPEQHKSGAWHFHALISQYKGTLRDSKHTSSTGRRVYNITSYRSGFSTAVKIDDREAVAVYVSKYITKDFIRMFNRRRFACSRNLIRPTKYINSDILKNTLPLFKEKIYEDQDFFYYSIIP